MVCRKTSPVIAQIIRIRALERSSERTGLDQKRERTSAKLPATARYTWARHPCNIPRIHSTCRTRCPPRIPWKTTRIAAAKESPLAQRSRVVLQTHAITPRVISPTPAATNRWACSRKTSAQAVICDHGKVNMLCPKVPGQSGTAMPATLVVTWPPIVIRKRIEPTRKQAAR